MKVPLRPFEYLAWARAVPPGARFNLSASGMPDAAKSAIDTKDTLWAEATPNVDLCRRDRGAAAIQSFVDAIASRYDIDAAGVIPTMGASQALLHTLIALVRAGDHVVVERPTYEPLHRIPEVLGARVSRLQRTFEDGWKVVPERLAQLLTSRTRAVILTNFHNPSGVAINAEALREIAELAGRVGALVLVDEVYLDFDFSIDPSSATRPACVIAPNTVSWSSCTKAFGVGALRAGWIVTPNIDLAKAINAASDYMFSYPPASMGLLGTRVLEQAAAAEARAKALSNQGRRIVQRWVQADPRVSWVEPPAGLTGLLRLPDLMSDVTFTEHLRERYDTQVAPGSLFEAAGYIRLSFGVAPADLEQGLANITATLDDLM